MTSSPRQGLTTDRNMVRSDALPAELRGTCRYGRLNFKVMFEVSYVLQRSNLEKHIRYFIGRRNLLCDGLELT